MAKRTLRERRGIIKKTRRRRMRGGESSIPPVANTPETKLLRNTFLGNKHPSSTGSASLKDILAISNAEAKTELIEELAGVKDVNDPLVKAIMSYTLATPEKFTLIKNIRKAIITQFPQHISTQGDIDYIGVLYEIYNPYLYKEDYKIFDPYYLSVRKEGKKHALRFETLTLYLMNSTLPNANDTKFISLLTDTNDTLVKAIMSYKLTNPETLTLINNIRTAIITQFPQYVSTAGAIDYKGILYFILKKLPQDYNIFDSYYLSAREEGAINALGFETPTLYLVNSKLPTDNDMRFIDLFIDYSYFYNAIPNHRKSFEGLLRILQ